MSGLKIDFSIDKERIPIMLTTMKTFWMTVGLLALSCTAPEAYALSASEGNSVHQKLEMGKEEKDVQLAKEKFQSGLVAFSDVLEAEKNLIVHQMDQAESLQDKIDVQRELVECLKRISEQMQQQSAEGDAEKSLQAKIAYLDAKRRLAYMEHSIELENVLIVKLQLEQSRYERGLAGIDAVLAARRTLILHRRDLAVNANERLRLQRDLTALLQKEYELQQQRQDSSVAEGGSRLLHECEPRHRDAVEELKRMETAAG